MCVRVCVRPQTQNTTSHTTDNTDINTRNDVLQITTCAQDILACMHVCVCAMSCVFSGVMAVQECAFQSVPLLSPAGSSCGGPAANQPFVLFPQTR